MIPRGRNHLCSLVRGPHTPANSFQTYAVESWYVYLGSFGAKYVDAEGFLRRHSLKSKRSVSHPSTHATHSTDLRVGGVLRTSHTE